MVQWSSWKNVSFDNVLNKEVKIAFFDNFDDNLFGAGDCRIINVVVIIQKLDSVTSIATIYCDAETLSTFSGDYLHFDCQLRDKNENTLVHPVVINDNTRLDTGELYHIKQIFTFNSSYYDSITKIYINIGG